MPASGTHDVAVVRCNASRSRLTHLRTAGRRAYRVGLSLHASPQTTVGEGSEAALYAGISNTTRQRTGARMTANFCACRTGLHAGARFDCRGE